MKKTILTSVIAISSILMAFPVFAEGEEVTSAGQTATIQEYLGQALPANPNRKIVYDDITGVLTLTDTPSNQEMAKELVKLWDVGTSQVKIQARFVEIAVNDVDELGVEWWARRTQKSPSKHRFSGFGAEASSVSNRDLTADDQWTFAEANETSGLGLEVGKLTQMGSWLRIYLKALAEQGKANLLSSPSVTTLSGQMANIQMANIIPYASDFTRTNIGRSFAPIMVEVYKVSEKVTGIMLEVTPTVAGDSRIITMDIHPEVSTLATNIGVDGQVPISQSGDFPTGLGYPVIDTRTAQTSVVIRSGETVVLGGLIREDEQVTNKKVPVLGDIPLIGNLFKTKHVDKTKKNLVIFLTATILDSRGEPVL